MKFPTWEATAWVQSGLQLRNKQGGVLVLAVVELIFFLLSATVLWCLVRKRVMLVTHWWFGCCWVVQDSSVFPNPVARRGTRSQEGPKPRQLIWTGPRDIPDHQSGRCEHSIVNNLSFLGFISLFIVFFSVPSLSIKIIIILFYSKDDYVLFYFNH